MVGLLLTFKQVLVAGAVIDIYSETNSEQICRSLLFYFFKV